MKRITLIVSLFFLCNMVTFAQQSPKDIQRQLKLYEKQMQQYDNAFDTIYLSINQQIEQQKSNPGNVAIWQSCMAQLLSTYYQQNRWRIMDRTALSDEEANAVDFNTWDAQRFAKEIIKHYLLSIENKEALSKIPIREYAVLLDSVTSETYRPTLYDFLAFRFLDFLKDEIYELPIPEVPFDVNDERYWAEPQQFANIDIPATDELSFSYLTLYTLQELTLLHLNEPDCRALLDATLRRFEYLGSHSTLDNASDLQLAALTSMEKQYQGKEGYEMVTNALGNFYQKRGSQYDKNTHPEYKNDYIIAIDWFNKTIAAAPKSIEARNAKNDIKEIKSSEVKFSSNKIIPANQANLITFSYKNCENLYFRVVSCTKEDFELKRISDNKKFYAWLIQQKEIYDTELNAPNEKDYRGVSGHFLLPSLDAGFYVLLASDAAFTNENNKGYSFSALQVTNIDAQYRQNGKKLEFFVFDRTTGQPLKGAEVKVSLYPNYNASKASKSILLNCDADGKCSCEITDNAYTLRASASWQQDKYQIIEHQYWGRYHDDPKVNISEKAYTFTDRSIYRPGQTVYFKTILVETTSVENFILQQKTDNGQNFTVELYDANHQKVAEQQLTSNEYGSASGSFVLPNQGLTGSFHLQIKLESKYLDNHYFSVEEYKRPTFEITLDQPTEEFKIGQNVSVDGHVKAYAGYGIGGANVKYHVVRKASFPWWRWWWWQPTGKSQEIAHGETTSDNEGNFHIDFIAQPDLESQRYNPLYTYEISVDVTDITGETHSGSTRVLVSKIGLLINAEFPESIALNGKNQFPVKITNLAGETQKGTIHYRIEALQTPENYKYSCSEANYYLSDSIQMIQKLHYLDFQNETQKSNWKVLKTVKHGDFVTDGQNPFIIQDMKNLQEAYYKISLSTYDKDNNQIQEEYYVLIYDEKSKKCANYEAIWLTTSDKNTIEVGETIHFTLGSYLKNAMVLCEIVSNDELVESKWVKLNQGKADFSYTVTEKDLGKVVVHAFVTQNNKQYEKNLNFNIPFSHKKIDFDFLTFRDKTLPGSLEQYQIRLKDKNGDKVAAELLCSMYDASLDALASPNSWISSIFNSSKPSYNYSFRLTSNNGNSYYRNFQKTSYDFISRNYPQLLWEINSWRRNRLMMSKAAGAYTTNGVEVSMEMDLAADFDEAEEVVLNTVADNIKVNTDLNLDENLEKGTESTDNQIRTNFNETAFFFPHLQTDKEGNVLVSFTIPESLTRWKLQGFAHNNELMSGYFEKFVQTQKPLMVVPNMPRFLREGDLVVLSAKVVNMGEEQQSGQVKLTLTNPFNGEKLDLTNGISAQSFTVEAGQSKEVHFTLTVPKDLGAVTYRIEAQNDQSPAYADGEEATLPILTNRILVTESLPLHISGKGSKTFTFNKLKNSFSIANSTLSTQSYTLEFTPNPIWYAIQALPYLMEYPHECNEQVFSRLYANTLAAHLVNSHPRIKTVFDSWLNESPNAFCSQLEKNQELKSVILEETPWVLDAQNESMRKQNIALLFDLHRMAKENKAAVTKLEKAQNNDGGWSWFGSHESSRYITQHIVAGCGHLQVLGVQNPMSDQVIRKAVNFIDNKAREIYDKWYRGKKADYDMTDIHYLYARSFFLKQKVSTTNSEAYNYYYANLKKNWKKQSIYTQAMTALICYRNGDTQLAQEIVANIKSRAQYSEEMGMFWKKEGYGYFWYEAPIERQALLIEAFNTITKDQKSVEQMQLWLLKQKQTQNWPTTKSTTEAVYALLLNNTQLENTNGVKLTMGDWSYTEGDKSMQAEAGTGYIKKAWKGSEVTEDMATIKIDKSSNGPAWGGLYWQYLENLDKVSHSDDQNFSIQKKLYKVEIGNRGEVLVPITENAPLKVGDKVRVRTEIRCDRDMEYVHLKDMRASAFEPVNVLSQYKHQDGLWYYEATGDAATNFFIDYLPKGTYVFEYTLIATMAGTYSNGITTIQCMYAPEFTSHSEGIQVTIQ
ncbi:MAG: hypothetical protein J6P65_05065 [Bacteroidales bacterium]|nr:hypothetical protein [Bacteroidales bacterium]